MISVTAAAHSFRRASRPIGTHVKAYGSGRIAVSRTEDDLKSVKSGIITSLSHHSGLETFSINDAMYRQRSAGIFNFLWSFLFKIWIFLIRILRILMPFLFIYEEMEQEEANESKKIARKNKTHKKAPIEILEDDLLLRIFKKLDPKSVVMAEMTCEKWHDLIVENLEELPKILMDQIKLHFDEGEVLVYPIDEKKVPSRHRMPSVERLACHMKHMTVNSLFIRGLIPIETTPVVRSLSNLRLDLNQIYFLWCDFDGYAETMLTDLFTINYETLSDIGFEVCTPPTLISDQLIMLNLPKLASLRIWNNGAFGSYLITDQTLLELAGYFSSSSTHTKAVLETLDLANTQVTVSGVSALIEAWFKRPNGHLSISLHNGNVHRNDVIKQCQRRKIPITTKGLRSDDYQLSLYVTE